MLPSRLLALVVLVLATVALTTAKDDDHNSVIIDAPAGKIAGFRERVKYTGSKVDVFLGIPFGEPPVGDLRFKRPLPAKKWSGTFEASQQPNSCMQIIDEAYDRFPGVDMWNPNTERSEDCLYLNVWTPAGAKDTKKKYPVLVWIFGGGFFSGTTTLELYNGKYLASNQDVILVGIQYRVGVYGFLYTGTDDAPGNQGLLDQVLALEWVKKNIGAFGGDVDSVTLFGESAGAASVGFHLMSPLTQNLFHRAILQSSGPNSPYAYKSQEWNIDRAEKIAKQVGCEPGPDMVACMRKVGTEVLTVKQWNVIGPFFDLTNAPTVDGYYLEKTPDEYLADGEFKKCPIITGSLKDEGIYFMMYGMAHLFPFNGSSTGDKKAYDEAVRLVVDLPDNDSLIYDAIEFEYLQSISAKERGSYRDVIDDVMGDYNFLCPVHAFAEAYAAAGADTYVYRFMHRSPLNPWPEWMGVMHGYEIEYIFGRPLNRDLDYKHDDTFIARRMMQYVGNFAKSGNPNKSKKNQKNSVDTWPKFDMEDKKLIYIDGTQYKPRVGSGPRISQCALWNQFIPHLKEKLKEQSDKKEEKEEEEEEEDKSHFHLDLSLKGVDAKRVKKLELLRLWLAKRGY